MFNELMKRVERAKKAVMPREALYVSIREHIEAKTA